MWTMETPRGRRRVIPLGLVSACLLLACCSSTFALNPNLDVSQYAHTSWKIRDGFPKGEISSLAQTPDGYLWIGTEFGLFRFDGVRHVQWHPPGSQLPSNWIFSLLVARDGTLWIGTEKGLVSWKDGKLSQYAELAGRYIFKLLEDREGAIWVSGAGCRPEDFVQSGMAAFSALETTAVSAAWRSTYTRTARAISGSEC